MKRGRFIRRSLLAKGVFIAAFSLVWVLLASCTPLMQEFSSEKTEIDSERTPATIPMLEYEGQMIVPLPELLQKLEFKVKSDVANQQLSFGDTDVVFRVQAGHSVAVTEAGGESVSLPDEPVWRSEQLWLTPEAAGALLADTARFQTENHHLILVPAANMIRPFDEEAELRGMKFTPDFRELPVNADGGAGEEVTGAKYTAQSNIKVERLISEARKYIGVDYEFGASSYAQSGTFDCSSFVRHVYGKFGINLPRVSRNQAQRGTTVSRSNLKRGDLLFFYVPGRFRTNETVGHVGIYIGNNQMIHSAPEPKDGVQITDINKPYWKETFLRARRII